jgi:glycerophosphoryl diester phosphodiesterase
MLNVVNFEKVTMKNSKILAHQGYLIKGEPGNSIPAFNRALRHGVDGFEFDVHLTADNKFVCFHDDTLSKLGRDNAVKDLSQNELTSIELAEGISIPSLEEVLDRYGNKVTLNIEIKSRKKGGEELVKLIHQYNLDPPKLIVSSFFSTPLIDIKKTDPDIPTGWLCYFAKNQVRMAMKLNCDAIHPYYDIIPTKWVRFHSFWISTNIHKFYVHRTFKNAQRLGLNVNPWTVNDEKYLRSAILRHVDSIITDNVERAIALRNQLSSK